MLTHRIDLSAPAAVVSLVIAGLHRFRRLDIVVNSAGVGSFGAVEDLGLDHWRSVFAVNTDAVFVACAAALPALRPSRGAIVNVASICGLFGDRAATPLGRIGDPAEIAQVIAFLASDAASYVTGHALVADDGMTASSGQPNYIQMLSAEDVPGGRA